MPFRVRSAAHFAIRVAQVQVRFLAVRIDGESFVQPCQRVVVAVRLLGDFREETVLQQLQQALGEAPVDLVLSDMAPNLSGVNAVDQPRSMHLVELAEEFAAAHLRKGGAFLTKLFQGEGFDEFVRRLRTGYERVSIRKPKASRARSPEVYALAVGKRG